MVFTVPQQKVRFSVQIGFLACDCAMFTRLTGH